jgi:hypothetical protein
MARSGEVWQTFALSMEKAPAYSANQQLRIASGSHPNARSPRLWFDPATAIACQQRVPGYFFCRASELFVYQPSKKHTC